MPIGRSKRCKIAKFSAWEPFSCWSKFKAHHVSATPRDDKVGCLRRQAAEATKYTRSIDLTLISANRSAVDDTLQT